MNVGIWFPEQDEVSVRLESAVVDEFEERFYESALLALVAARQIANLGGDWVARSLAETLFGIDDGAARLYAEQKLGDVRLVSGATGGKGFTAEFRPEKRAFFKLHAHGMGALGRGTGYYAPTSVVALLAYLLRRRSDDAEYQARIAAAAKLVGYAGLEGAIKITTQAKIAMEAAGAAWMMEPEGDEDPNQQSGPVDEVDDDDDLSLSKDALELLAKDALQVREREQVVLEDADGGRFGFRLLGVRDPIDATTDAVGLAPLQRYVGVELEIENLVADDDAWTALTALLTIDAAVGREAVEMSLAEHDPGFDLVPELDPGERRSGYLLFEIPFNARAVSFKIGLDDAPAAAEWPLQDQRANLEPGPAAEQISRADESIETAGSNSFDGATSADAIEQIRRLATLRDAGILSEDEFQAKKSQLLDRI
jgi:hypothetical protein